MNDWLDAEQRIERAQQLSESMRWAEALAEMDAALAINPHNGTWHAQRGYLLEELERPTEAISAYEYAVELEPDDRDVSMALGAGLLRLGRLARALSIFEQLIQSHPDFEPAYCHAIAAYAELGQHEKAEQMFYLAQEIDERCPHCFFNMAESLAIRGDTERAIYCWQQVLEIEPSYMGVNRRIAQAYREAGESELARDYYLNELRDDPGSPELLYELAELALEDGELASAAARFSHIVDLHQDHVEARYALGKIWLIQGHNEEALRCFEAIEAIEKHPGLSEFDRRMGEALFKLGRVDEANRRFEKAIEKDGEQEELLMVYGTSLLAANRIEAAADCYRKVLARDGENGLAHHSLAVCLLKQEKYELGLDHCEQAIAANPDSVASRCNAAYAMMRLGQWGKARHMLAEALKVEPNNALVKGLLDRSWRYRISYFWDRLLRIARLR
ncbi:MAG: tetratricopeptide repeat protein [Phycisphaerae bacterium]